MLELMHGQNIIHDWKFRYLKNYRQRLLASSKNCKTAQAWNFSYENRLPKGPVPLFASCQKRVQEDAMYILCFLYILVPYVYLYTQFQNLPGRVNCWISLKFTEKYYKKLSFSIETNPFHVLWFEKFRSLISRSRTTKRATLLFIQGIIVLVLLLC